MKLLYYSLLFLYCTSMYSFYNPQVHEQHNYQEVNLQHLLPANQNLQANAERQAEYLCACNTTLTDQAAWEEHIQAHHSQPAGGYACPLCPEKRFNLTCQLKDHIVSNHTFLCKCLLRFNDKSELFEHIENNHKSAEEKYQCPGLDCPYSVARRNRWQLIRHMSYCQAPAAQNAAHALRYICKCSRSFAARRAFLDHINHAHLDPNDQKIYTCPACNKHIHSSYNADPSSLRRHMERCKTPMLGQQPAQDYAAPAAQVQQAALPPAQAHITPAAQHQPAAAHNATFNCSCNQQLTSQEHLDIHITTSHRYTHGNQEAFICDRCKYAAFTLLLFKNHLLNNCQPRD